MSQLSEMQTGRWSEDYKKWVKDSSRIERRLFYRGAAIQSSLSLAAIAIGTQIVESNEYTNLPAWGFAAFRNLQGLSSTFEEYSQHREEMPDFSSYLTE